MRNKKTKKVKKLFFPLLCAMTLMLTGCSESAPYANMDGSILEYSEGELVSGNYYIKHGDIYYPLLNHGIGSDPVFHQWFTDCDQLIPELQKGDELIYYSESSVPETTTFTKMKDYGYTVGVRFNVENAKISFGTSDSDVCLDSNLPKFSELLNGSTVAIKEINNMEFKTSMLTSNGYLRGLTKNALYRFNFYKGTVYRTLDLTADAHLFVEESSLSSNSYLEKKERTFKINLPAAMSQGYYSLNNNGLFKLVASNTNIEDNTEDEEETKDNKDNTNESTADDTNKSE